METKNITIKPANATGTSLQGYYRGSYNSLVEALGQPDRYEGDKVTCEWSVRIGGTIVTVYNWKDSSDPKYLRNWHVGGSGEMAVHALNIATESINAYPR
mgnify:CR=1 FL=1